MSAILGDMVPKRIVSPAFAAAITSPKSCHPFEASETIPIWKPAVVVSGVMSACE